MHILILESLHEAGINRLRAESYSVRVALGLSRHEILKRIGEADAIVVKSAVRVDAELLECSQKLKVVGRAGVGTDNIDKASAVARGVAVLTVPGGNADAGADFAVMQILCLVRNAYQAQAMVAEGDFRRDLLMGRDLRALTVGIIGLGHVGRGVAKRLMGFGCSILGFDPHINTEEMRRLGIEVATNVDELIAAVDVLTIHASLTPDTWHLINAARLERARRGLVLVNVARGAIIDEVALATCVKSGQVAAAALDVFEDEPPFDKLPREHTYDHPLLHVPGVVVTPHMAASTEDAQRNIAVQLADKIIATLGAG